MVLAIRNNVNATALQLLPGCVKQCSKKISETYVCQPNDPCFCSETSPRAKALQSCLKKNCSLDDQLAAQRLQAETCGIMPRDEQPEMRAVIYTLFIFAMILTLARLLSRWPRLRGAGYWWDDFVVCIGGFVLAAMMVDSEFELRNGVGRDMWMLNQKKVTSFLMWFYIAEPIYVLGTRLPKLSLVFLYLRLWPEKGTTFRRLCWLVAILLMLSAISGLFATTFSCNPISYIWLRVVSGSSGSCVNRTVLSVAQAATVIFFDVVVILLPIPKLLKLPLSPQYKAGVCSVFLVGFAVTACSGVRISYITTYSTSKNPTYDFYNLALWSHIEVYLSMICCSMPQMPGLLRRLWWFLTKGKQRLESNASAGAKDNGQGEPAEKIAHDEVAQLEEAEGGPADLTALPDIQIKH